MPRFSSYFQMNKSQHQLDFVDIDNEEDIPVYVDPYAIEIQGDDWAVKASEYVRVFFDEVLESLRAGKRHRAEHLMSHLTEPRETFLGVSRGKPRGRGVGQGQAKQLITAILMSKAYQSGLLSDLSEMALYVDGIDRDKISDLTTNIIRSLLVDYTQQQCALYNIETKSYVGPPLWEPLKRGWISKSVQLPYIEGSAVLLVPKYIVRRKLSIDSQEFYNKQITEFLVAEHYRVNSSLVHLLENGESRVFKGEVREETPKSKTLIADLVNVHPELLEMYKEIAKKQRALITFTDEAPSMTSVCKSLASTFSTIPAGASHANSYHELVMGSLTALFYPDLVQPHKEWEIHGGRKRIDIVFTNAADTGFFAHRRNDNVTHANTVIVECKNYSNNIANNELDQLLGRFDINRGKLGIITCRQTVDAEHLAKRCRDASSRSQGYILVFTDKDIIMMLTAKAELDERKISLLLMEKFRQLLE